MANLAVLTETKLDKLINDLKRIITEGKHRAVQTVREENIYTYWEVGRRITQEHLSSNAGYEMTVYDDIADELGLDPSTIKRSVYFFQRYPDRAPRGTNLCWSHYRELVSIPDAKERRWYEQRASKEKWTRDQLVVALKRNAYEDVKNQKVRARRAVPLKRPTEATYVYKALVERPVDGDTLLLRIDLGFQVWKEQRVRLAGIDCPEMGTADGREAFEYVRDRLARVPFVVIRTNKIDIYGRYVAHVFYSLTETKIEKVFSEGKFLNQELLDKGFAKLV